LAEIALLRCKSPMSTKELRIMAELKTRLLVLCPPERYAWRGGLPVCDILETLHNQTEIKK
jgi:hypothetical protein